MDSIKFSQILKFQEKSHIKAGDGLTEGSYPFFTSSPTLSKYSNSFQFNMPSLIFGTGGNASIHLCENPFSVSTDCLVAQLRSDFFQKFDIKFIYYYLSGNIWILEQGFKGAGLKHISKGFIDNIDIPKLTLDDQKRIVEVFDKVDYIRQKRKESLNLLDDYLRSVFLDMFGDLHKNDKNWTYSNLGKFILNLTDYHANGSYETLKKNVTLLSEPDYALMVRTSDLESNNFIKDVKYIDQHAYNFLDKSKVYGGEMIINKIGSAGKVYLMPKLNRPVSLGMNAFLLRFNEYTDTQFMYYLLRSKYGEDIIQKKVKGAVTKTIRKDAIRDLTIPNIPIVLQKKFSDVVQKTESLKQKMLKQSGDLDIQFQALMQKSFVAS